jgi:hypothetical protein
MSTARSFVSLAGTIGMVLLLGQGTAFGQAQSKDQQGCINALNKDGAKVGATQGKENTACIKNAGKSGGAGAQDCLTEDSKGKVAKAASKVQADFDKKCTTETPDFGVPGVPAGTAQAVAAAGQDDEVLLVADIFGSPLDTAISTDKTEAKCQSTLSKDYEKTFATYMKQFLKCKKTALKDGGDESALEDCVLDDTGGKAAATIGKIDADLAKNCIGLDTASLFPGLCADVPLVALAECVGRQVRCRACMSQDRMDGLHANCDALDDGTENGSCAAGRASECTLAAGSSFPLSTALGPINLAASGSLDIAIGGSEGTNDASCHLRSLDPVNLAGVGFVCVSPATGCPVGSVDCAGGSSKGVSLNAQRTIGACTNNDNCDSLCDASCAGTVIQSACEGFCTGDSPANQACTTDADCLGNGACAGQDGVPNGNICECQCLASLPDSTPPGGLRCSLGTSLVVEIAAPCDGSDVLITVGSACFPLTTTSAFGIINNANANQGSTLGPFVGNGATNSCFEQDGNDTSGMNLVGSYAFFASTIGDILTGAELICE